MTAGSYNICDPMCSRTCWPCERSSVTVGKHQGQSEVVVDPISSKSQSLSQMKHASPVKFEADIILAKLFEQLVTYQNPGNRDILQLVQALGQS